MLVRVRVPLDTCGNSPAACGGEGRRPLAGPRLGRAPSGSFWPRCHRWGFEEAGLRFLRKGFILQMARAGLSPGPARSAPPARSASALHPALSRCSARGGFRPPDSEPEVPRCSFPAQNGKFSGNGVVAGVLS